MAGYDNFVDPPVIPADKKKIRKIWKTAGMLAFLTAIEFLIAFTVDSQAVKAVTFVLMTIVKAYYIVAEFMHLAHEKRALVLSILLPTVFLMWAIVAFLYEADRILNAIRTIWEY